MSIPDPIRTNFQTLLRAAEAGHLALLECTDAKTGGTRFVIRAIHEDGGAFAITLFGHMVSDGNPYEAYVPPTV